jgi:hypothetical protein
MLRRSIKSQAGERHQWPTETIMPSQILGLRVASFIFALMCLGQFLRLILNVDVQVAGHSIPWWPSGLAVVIAGGLSLWMWSLSRRTLQH